VRIFASTRSDDSGFDRGDTPLKPSLTPIQLRTIRLGQARARRARLVEAVTWSFILSPGSPHAELFRGGKSELALAIPLPSDCPTASSLLPGLVAAAQANSYRRFPDGGWLSRCLRSASVLGRQAGCGINCRGPQACSTAFASFSRPRGALFRSTIAKRARRQGRSFACYPAARRAASGTANRPPAGGAPWLHPGRSGTIQIRPQNLRDIFASCNPRTLEAAPPRRRPSGAFEVIPDRIPDAKQKPTRASRSRPIGRRSEPVRANCCVYRSIRVKSGDMVRAAQRGQDADHGGNLFDVDERQGIDDCKKSVLFPSTNAPREKNQTDQEIEAVRAAKIVAAVNKKTGWRAA